MSDDVEEHGVRINVKGTSHAPKKNEVVYNSEMLVNRSLVLCALAAYHKSGLCTNAQVRCLDALGATGVAGLTWARHLPEVGVTINDQLPVAKERISDNAATNNLEINITSEDVSILLLQRPFDFVFLDCYGSSVHYLDAAFRNAPKHSVLAITSTDDAALYGKAADVTLRNYGGYVVKTSYAKELAARLVLGSVVRAAAKSNKGVEVLCCIALKSFITVMVRVLRGPAAANSCVRKIRRIIHCCVCEDRAFYPETVYPIEEPYSLLSCDCRSKSGGKLSVELGPVWCDEIFDASFCQAMLEQGTTKLHLPHKVTALLQTIVNEAKCREEVGTDEGESVDKENTVSGVAVEDKTARVREDKEEDDGEDETTAVEREDEEVEEEEEDGERSLKRVKTTHRATMLRSPAFYFNLHRHSPKGHDLGKINRVVDHLRRAHHKASRTHFDPEAIRTDCTLKDFTRLLLEFSKAHN